MAGRRTRAKCKPRCWPPGSEGLGTLSPAPSSQAGSRWNPQGETCGLLSASRGPRPGPRGPHSWAGAWLPTGSVLNSLYIPVLGYASTEDTKNPVYLQNIKKSVNHLHINPPFCHFVHALVWKKIKTFFKKRKQMITGWERAISTLCQQAWSPGPCWARAPRSLGSVQAAAAGGRAGGRGPTVLDIKHRRRSARGGVCRPTGRNDFVHRDPRHGRGAGLGAAAAGVSS